MPFCAKNVYILLPTSFCDDIKTSFEKYEEKREVSHLHHRTVVENVNENTQFLMMLNIESLILNIYLAKHVVKN